MLSYGITPQQLPEVTASGEVGCFSLVCYMESGLNWTLGFQNVSLGRSLGLRVAPELRMFFRLRRLLVALVAW